MCLCCAIEKGAKVELIPLLCIQVHSGDNYRNSVDKTIADCVNHLCLIRNMNPAVSAVIGFTFPKISPPRFVTKVVARWEAWRFKIALIELPEGEVDTSLSEALTQTRAIVDGLLHEVPVDLNMLPLWRSHAVPQPKSTRTIPSWCVL